MRLVVFNRFAGLWLDGGEGGEEVVREKGGRGEQGDVHL